ncbi:ester hydrolase C11orf54 homolog [Oppia nitens]|uniref:ester hydrolase C11orf54 homolog n=1 Tax=Oppia nitens TaxID=1686743 RepID=UPI0023DAE035|nr:ester hydrolase C11orf54 homolog [Oppia nitens]XP_054168678.1 ester hydrolase C11orf54 homolog [Oppia nitens]
MFSGHKLGLTYRKLDLNPPSLEEVSHVLRVGLKEDFEVIDVSVVECPDLRQSPFHLAQRGLSGNEKIADIGGVPYLAPIVQRDKYYSFKDMVSVMEMNEKAFFIGAGAGPFKEVQTNCELMPNISFENNCNDITNKTHFAKIDEKGGCELSLVKTMDFALLCNLFASEGQTGPVIKVSAKKRIGSNNFVSTIREILAKHYDKRPVSLGGVFLIKSGSAKLHIMPDFSKTPLNTNEDVNNWLKYYTMDSPLICLSVFHSFDPQLDLRIEHTHCFSDHNQGGHYHYDTTPDEVEYEAYFNVAKQIYRIDSPVVTHNIGRD